MLAERILHNVSNARRLKRRQVFEQTFPVLTHWKILDIGCGENWRSPWFDPQLDVTGLDYRDIPPEQLAYRKFVCSDAAQRFPFADGEFDLAFSNSLIEHLPSRDAQASFASEVARVARHFWVQTPNTDFPIDPHYMLPFFQHLPRKVQVPIAASISGSALLGGYYITQGFHMSEQHFHNVYGLNPRSLQKLFSSARILHFRFAGLSQSIVALKA
jgi:SAM-dependent methyltransferase